MLLLLLANAHAAPPLPAAASPTPAADLGQSCIAVPVTVTPRALLEAVALVPSREPVTAKTYIPPGYGAVSATGPVVVDDTVLTVMVACRPTTPADIEDLASDVQARCLAYFSERDAWTKKGWSIKEFPAVPLDCAPYEPKR